MNSLSSAERKLSSGHQHFIGTLDVARVVRDMHGGNGSDLTGLF